MESKKQFKTIDEYIASFSEDVQTDLQRLRRAIKEAAPEAEETISYQMPAFRLGGILVWFAAFKSHIGFYPTASAIEAFKEKLSKYETSKGTIRFHLSESIPFDLIKEIVRYRVKRNMPRKAHTSTA